MPVIRKPLIIVIIVVALFTLVWYSGGQRDQSSLPLPTAQRIVETAPGTSANTTQFAFEEYRNGKLGVSFKYPAQTLSYYARCKKDQDGYYTTDLDLLPVTVVEDGNTLYITNPYYFEASGEKTVGEYIYNKKCGKVETTLPLLRKNEGPGHIIKVANAQSDTEINAFIKSLVREGCVLEKKEARRDGQFTLYVKDIGNKQFGGCYPTGYTLTYNPIAKKVAYFRYGQDCVFFQGQEGKEICLSEILRDSIRMF